MARLLASTHHCEGQLLAMGVNTSSRKPGVVAFGIGLARRVFRR